MRGEHECTLALGWRDKTLFQTSGQEKLSSVLFNTSSFWTEREAGRKETQDQEETHIKIIWTL